jgi:hypothetical protein
LIAACIVLCCILLQTVAWVRAKLLEEEEEDHQAHEPPWNLLQHVDLMHYSALASDDLKSHFRTSESGSREVVGPGHEIRTSWSRMKIVLYYRRGGERDAACSRGVICLENSHFLWLEDDGGDKTELKVTTK